MQLSFNPLKLSLALKTYTRISLMKNCRMTALLSGIWSTRQPMVMGRCLILILFPRANALLGISGASDKGIWPVRS